MHEPQNRCHLLVALAPGSGMHLVVADVKRDKIPGCNVSVKDNFIPILRVPHIANAQIRLLGPEERNTSYSRWAFLPYLRQRRVPVVPPFASAQSEYVRQSANRESARYLLPHIHLRRHGNRSSVLMLPSVSSGTSCRCPVSGVTPIPISTKSASIRIPFFSTTVFTASSPSNRFHRRSEMKCHAAIFMSLPKHGPDFRAENTLKRHRFRCNYGYRKPASSQAGCRFEPDKACSDDHCARSLRAGLDERS